LICMAQMSNAFLSRYSSSLTWKLLDFSLVNSGASGSTSPLCNCHPPPPHQKLWQNS
jgi:hypothetical protein